MEEKWERGWERASDCSVGGEQLRGQECLLQDLQGTGIFLLKPQRHSSLSTPGHSNIRNDATMAPGHNASVSDAASDQNGAEQQGQPDMRRGQFLRLALRKSCLRLTHGSSRLKDIFLGLPVDYGDKVTTCL